jgi:hypothetical protein
MRYLPLAILAASMILAWGSLKDTSANSEKRITALEASDKASRDVQNQMLVQLSQIQADLKWLINKEK